MPRTNEFEQDKMGILTRAGKLYHLQREGKIPEYQIIRETRDIGYVPVIAEDSPTQAMKAGQLREKQIEVAARAVARLADLKDRADAGGIGGLFARFEVFITTKAEYFYLRGVGNAGGIVDTIRRGKV